MKHSAAFGTLLCVSCALQEVPGDVCDYKKGDVPVIFEVFPASRRKFVSPAEPWLNRTAAVIVLLAMSTELVWRVSSHIWVSQSVVRFWIPYFWITSTPTSLLTIYLQRFVDRHKEEIRGLTRNRIIGVEIYLCQKNSSYAGYLSRTYGEIHLCSSSSLHWCVCRHFW